MGKLTVDEWPIWDKQPMTEAAIEITLSDLSESYDFTAKSYKHVIRFSKTVALKPNNVLRFLLWLAPKLGVQAKRMAERYDGCKVFNRCISYVEVRHEDCQGDSDVEDAG